MATLSEKLQEDLSVARATVASLEAQAAALPADIGAIEESVWVEINAFLGVV